jgi:hypothetical protein
MIDVINSILEDNKPYIIGNNVLEVKWMAGGLGQAHLPVSIHNLPYQEYDSNSCKPIVQYPWQRIGPKSCGPGAGKAVYAQPNRI